MIKKTGGVLVVVLGTIITGVGIQIIVTANMGVDSISTLIMGLIQHTPITFGRWSQLINVLFLVTLFFYRKELLGVGSIINCIFVGETIQLTAPLINQLGFLKGNLFFSLIGFLLMAFGSALYLIPNLGAGPLEGMMFLLCRVFALKIKLARILIDFSLVLLGFILGGTVNVGTLFAIFLLGPLIELFLRLLRPEKVLQEQRVQL